MAKKTVNASDVRISPRELKEHGVKYVLDKVRQSKGYFMTNTERDLSQSDFKNRVLPHTQMLVAEERNACGTSPSRSPEGPPSTWTCCASRSTPSISSGC